MKVPFRVLTLFFGITGAQASSFADSGWARQESGTTASLTEVSFVDVSTGTVVGVGGTILHTTTGGE